ncbi:MAG: hypothetical protein M1833_003806 [Piccolia ochrophora]|nr:MAG: hypothetical protein M1833_003806 [Piccolia ochrophora]
MAAFTSWCFLASFALLWGSTLAVEDAIVLKPLHAKVFERSVGLNIRSEVDFSTLSPADQALLAYGEDGGNNPAGRSPRGDGRYLLANMTLYAPNGLKIVMMERFEELTSAVDCEGDDGIMSLTFKSPEAFDQALKEWAWINTAEEKQFLLIANHEGCGPDDERQAYIISYVDQQEELFKTVLSAKPAPWDEIAGTFDLDFGSVSQESIVRRELNAPRGWGPLDDALDKLGDVAEGAKDVVGSVVDKFEDVGDLDIPKSVSFGVNAGSSGQRTTLYKDSG